MLSHSFEKKQFLKVCCKAAFCVLLLSITLFLSSCDINSGGQRTTTTNYYVGTKGLEFKFLEQAPQSELYEDSRFVVGFIVENSGASDVVEGDYGILSVGFDPFYIDASGVGRAENSQVSENSVIVSGIQLVGRSQLNPSGSSAYVSLPGFRVRTVVGQIESPTTQLLASLCYPYTTLFSGMVCVDLGLAGQDLRQQVCRQTSLTLTGQGAPVAITRIDVENQPVDSGGQSVVVRPVYTIHIKNLGSGSVLSPVVGSANLERVCSFQGITRQDFNTVNIEAILSASTRLTCTPNPVKLISDEGISRCEVSDEDLVIGSHNYETPLNIKLSYVYQSAASKKIEIKRINVYGTPTAPSTGCLDFEVASAGGCANKCDVCGNSSGAGAACQPPSDTLHPELTIKWQKGFACQCSNDMCDKLYPDGFCVPYSGWCPGVSYCCLPSCTPSNWVRLTDGKCYPKCGPCVKAPATNCSCGPAGSTIPTDYFLVTEGNFCCTRSGLVQSFGDLQSCNTACRATAGAG